MKNFKIWAACLCACAFAFNTACNKNINPDNNDQDGKQEQVSYLSITLASTDGTVSRATDGGYEDGTSAENKISKVRFYFFTESGSPANVKLNGSSYVNYYDWTPGDGDQSKETQTDNVSDILKATIVISTKDGDKLPRKIAAVMNPTEETAQSRALSILKNLTNDYAKSSLTKEGKFVMFNSIYVDNGAEVNAVSITAENLCKTSDEAIQHPVRIYVERNVAKVSVDLKEDAALTEGKLKLKDKNGDDLTVNGEQVYLKVNGWRLTAETDKGRLGKMVDLGWAGTWMNMPLRYRSCWAINAKGAANRYYKYNEISSDNIGAPIYTNENAEDFTENETTENLNRTKVIISGTLCKENGDAFTIVRHMGAHFADDYSATEDDNLNGLKRNILRQLTTNEIHYYYADGDDRKQIDISDLKIVKADQLTQENSKNNCYVYAQLTDAAKAKTWYDSEDAAATPIAATTIDNTLKDKEKVDWALVWRDGMTYYFYEIVHYGTGENATTGVVRNHVYKTSVTKIAGLGTPVYDPNEVIYPEKPENNEYYIAAKINILAWHIVAQDYVLEW